MDREREEQRELVRRMAAYANLSLTALADAAGVASTTVTRFVNNPDVGHMLSSRTIAKLLHASGYKPGDGVVVPFRPAADAEMFARIAHRMDIARKAMARSLPDQDVAGALGWDALHLAALLSGEAEPTIPELVEFSRRMRITTDFLLLGKLDGLERRSERLLLDTSPELLEDTEQRMGTAQAGRKKGPRR